MRWEDRRESSNIEDRRDGDGGGFGGGDDSGGFGGGGGGYSGGFGGGLPINIGGGGIGTIVIMLIIAWVLGINPMTLLSGTQVGPSQSYTRSERPPQRTPARNDQLTKFVAVVLGDTEDRWKEILPQQAGELVPKAAGMRYQEPKLVLFSGATRRHQPVVGFDHRRLRQAAALRHLPDRRQPRPRRQPTLVDRLLDRRHHGADPRRMAGPVDLDVHGDRPAHRTGTVHSTVP